MKRRFLGLAFLLAIAACVTVNKSILGTNPTGRAYTAAEVQVFFDKDSLPEHRRIAILSGSGSDEWTNESQMIDKLRGEAGKLGANAIVLSRMEDPGAGKKFVAAMFWSYPALVDGDDLRNSGTGAGRTFPALIPRPGSHTDTRSWLCGLPTRSVFGPIPRTRASCLLSYSMGDV